MIKFCQSENRPLIGLGCNRFAYALNFIETLNSSRSLEYATIDILLTYALDELAHGMGYLAATLLSGLIGGAAAIATGVIVGIIVIYALQDAVDNLASFLYKIIES